MTNDITDTSEKDIPYESFADLLTALAKEERAIVSTHPHRYSASAIAYRLKAAVFTVIRKTAKLLIKIPLMKKLMSRFYHLTKRYKEHSWKIQKVSAPFRKRSSKP